MQIFVEVWCFSLTIPQGFSVKSSIFIYHNYLLVSIIYLFIFQIWLLYPVN